MSSHEHPANPSWIWSGVHGLNSGIVHPFLAVRDDPHRRYFGLEDNSGFVNVILAGSGGLLLIKRSCNNRPPGDDDTSIDEDCSSDEDWSSDEEADNQSSTPLEAVHGQPSFVVEQHWQTLLVVNPSTHESRELPPANSMDVGLMFWSYTGVQANLFVDTISQTYTVTLTFPDCVCLYSSTSNAWRCRRFSHQGPWGPHNPELLVDPWETQIASAYVNGRLFFVDVVVEDSIPTMNLIEIDAEAGLWKLHNFRYSLRTLSTEFVIVDTPFHRMRGLTDHGMHQAPNSRFLALRHRDHCVPDSVLKLFQIVTCMGELYAVIPMGLNEYLPMSLRSRRTLMEVVEEYANFELCFMPLQFLIVSMRGGGFVHGVLRILVPRDMIPDVTHMMSVDDDGSEEGRDSGDEEDCTRQNDLLDLLGEYGTEPLGDFRWHYSCVAEGSVIWVSLMDYVLQYDVVTGVSKTEIIKEGSPDMSLEIQGRITVPYRPSSMKP